MKLPQKQSNQLAFTLVELIVVITILAILWTIAFISLQWYSAQARDSKRVSDIQNIKKSLELFSLNTWKYPKPDEFATVSYGSQDLRYQWTAWEQVTTNLSRNLNETPTDPLTWSEYTYSRTYAGTEYEVLSIYESDLISSNVGANLVFTQQWYSFNSNYPKINGNYNGVYVKAETMYVPTPSIINWNIWGNTNLSWDLTFLESQVITGGENVPWVSTWWLSWMTVEVFTWELDTTIWRDNNGNKELLAQALIDAYSWTTLASAWIYQEIVETSSWELVSLVDIFVLNNDNFTNITSNSEWWTSPSNLTYQEQWLCDEPDITYWWITIAACNLWTTTAATSYDDSNWYWDYFQFGRNSSYEDWTRTNWILAYSYDWKSPGGTDDWSANDWWVSESEKQTATYDNQNATDQSKMQWPCPSWYHVPTNKEWSDLVTVAWVTNRDTAYSILKMPSSGYYRLAFTHQGNYGFYWASSPGGTKGGCLTFTSSNISPGINNDRELGFSVRCFKN